MNVSTHRSRSTVLVRWVNVFRWEALRCQYGKSLTTRRRFACGPSMAGAPMGRGASAGVSMIAKGYAPASKPQNAPSSSASSPCPPSPSPLRSGTSCPPTTGPPPSMTASSAWLRENSGMALAGEPELLVTVPCRHKLEPCTAVKVSTLIPVREMAWKRGVRHGVADLCSRELRASSAGSCKVFCTSRGRGVRGVLEKLKFYKGTAHGSRGELRATSSNAVCKRTPRNSATGPSTIVRGEGGPCV